MEHSDILAFIDRTSGEPKYQTIEVKGQVIRKGTEECWKTWENIQSLGVDWKGREVLDIGCFNGYFTFKLAQAGAGYTEGWDINLAALQICDLLKEESDSHAVFKMENIEDLMGLHVDIILTLNMLHNYRKTVDNSRFIETVQRLVNNSKQYIVEANPEELDVVHTCAGYANKKITEVPSHRPGRWIWLVQ